MNSGETHAQLPVPAVFVVVSDNTIKFEYADPSFKVRLEPDVILAAAEAMVNK